MTITRVVDGNPAAATDLNQLIDLMEGAETIDYLLKSLVATDFKVRLADSAGARKLIIQDSTGAQVASIDSDGNATFTSVNLTTLVIPTSAAPAQTTDGSAVWNSSAVPSGKYLTVGDGTSRKQFQSATRGSDIASATTLLITDRAHRVTGAVTITALSTMPAGFKVRLTFASTPQLTHSASLRLAGAVNYTATAEETLEFESDGTNWREVGRKPTTTVVAPTVRVYTANDTWSKPAGLNYIRVRVVGGGGGGGGAAALNYGVGGGGGGGGYSEEVIVAASLGATETVTVGAAGAGGTAGNAGSAGGTTSFGTQLQATGGSGGATGTGSGANAIGGAGGTGSLGSINVKGSSGGWGHAFGADSVVSGAGGSSVLGGGAVSIASLTLQAGAAGGAYGGGGSGATNDNEAVGAAGGAGAAGVVIVEEF